MKTMQFLVSEIFKLTMTKKALSNTNSEEHNNSITGITADAINTFTS